MAETLLLIFIAGKIGNIAQDKGRSRVGYGLLTALLWFVGEIGLGVVGYNIGGDFLSAVPFGIAGAAIGAIVSYLIVSNLSDRHPRKSLPSTSEPRTKRKRTILPHPWDSPRFRTTTSNSTRSFYYE